VSDAISALRAGVAGEIDLRVIARHAQLPEQREVGGQRYRADAEDFPRVGLDDGFADAGASRGARGVLPEVVIAARDAEILVELLTTKKLEAGVDVFVSSDAANRLSVGAVLFVINAAGRGADIRLGEYRSRGQGDRCDGKFDVFIRGLC